MIRTPDDFELMLDLSLHDQAIVHPFIGDRLVCTEDDPRPRPWAFYRAQGLAASVSHSIGRWQGEDHLAVALDLAVPELPRGLRAAGLRNWFGVLDDRGLAIAMRAVQLLEWDRTHRHCGACGSLTERVAGERARRCPACSLSTYPRISPAMMVLVSRGRELLLARGLHFPPGRYSALAGFLEAGETIEQAIHREVREEVGVAIRELRYFGSQSWPFPNSLMIAFRAQWDSGEIRVDPSELADAGWFAPEQLPELPPRLSIARALIESALKDLQRAP